MQPLEPPIPGAVVALFPSRRDGKRCPACGGNAPGCCPVSPHMHGEDPVLVEYACFDCRSVRVPVRASLRAMVAAGNRALAVNHPKAAPISMREVAVCTPCYRKRRIAPSATPQLPLKPKKPKDKNWSDLDD